MNNVPGLLAAPLAAQSGNLAIAALRGIVPYINNLRINIFAERQGVEI